MSEAVAILKAAIATYDRALEELVELRQKIRAVLQALLDQEAQ